MSDRGGRASYFFSTICAVAPGARWPSGAKRLLGKDVDAPRRQDVHRPGRRPPYPSNGETIHLRVQEAMRLLASWSLDAPPRTAPLDTNRIEPT